MGVKKTCEVCGASATLVCSACHTSHYCSSDHRRRHWDTHRINCRPMTERSDPMAGRFMVTSRDVVAGELLLTETPIALGPGSASPLICLGCHQYITGSEFPRCPSCWWPLCSSACASSSLHQAECPILAVDAKRIGQPKAPGTTPRYDIILVLRCLLLRATDPSAWRRLLDMASHSQRRAQDGEQHHMATTQYIKEVLKVDYDPEDIHHARDVIITNCFEWRSPSGVSLRGVYPLLARLNHSCRPNVALSSDCDGTMYTRAATDLQSGDQVHVTYTNTTQPLWERRAYTRQIHYFTCDCVRCNDPTELGMHFSSPRCEHCPNQFLEATTWLGKVTWECPWCGFQKLEMVIRLEVEQWLARFESDDAFLNAGPHAIRNILEKVEEAFHPHHYVWVRAAQVAVKALQRDLRMDAAVLRRDLWTRLLKIYSVLEPGLSRRRGVTLYEAGLAQAVLTRLERDADVITDHFLKLQLWQSLDHLQEAMRVLNLEPERSRERRWYQRAAEAAAEVARELGVALPPAVSPPLVVAKDKSLQKRSEMTGSGTCGLCGAAATLRCGGCSSVHYCGREHQRKHWAKHKDECWPFTQMYDSEVGRYLVASRDLEEGQLVMRDEPLAMGPTADSRPVCLGCHAPITAEDHPRCPGCSWPLCSTVCADTPRHQVECSALATDAKKIGPPTSLMVTPRYDIILILRCLLLRSSNPAGWERIKAMGSHAERRWEDQEPHHCTAVRYFTEVLRVDCDVDTVRHLHGAIITNAINTYDARGVTLRGLYANVCIMNHSCHPNVTLRSDVHNTLYVRTAVPVRKGEPLMFSYVPPADPLWRRQADLRSIYYFNCACERCRDPTELGTHFSSPRCPECAEGFLDPNDGPGAPWSCSGCGKRLPEDDIIKQVDAYEKEIETKCTSFTEACKLLDRIKSTFHINHFVWMSAAKAALTTLGDEKSPATLSMLRDLWRRLIHLHERLEPGSTRRRGVSLYYAAVVEKDAALFHLAMTGDPKKPSEAFEDGLTRAIRMLDTSIQILSYEPPNSTELRWLHKAKAEKQIIFDLIGGTNPDQEGN